jgi:DNA polymerase-1
VDSVDKAAEFMRWLGERRRVLGVDTETGGFSPERNRLRLTQFGDLSAGWAIPWEGWGGVAMEALRKYTGELVLHNSKFDARFITRKTGITWPWHRTHDTMNLAHLDNPLRSKGLKPLAGMLVDPQAAIAQKLLNEAMTKNKWSWDTVPVNFLYYWVYAAMDPVLTCHIFEHLQPALTSCREVYDLEMGVTRVIAKMEAGGAHVDLGYSERKQRELMAWAHEARAWMLDAYKGQGLTGLTDMKLLDFFQSNNVPMLYKLTKSGSRQALDKEVLETIDHPVAEYILAVRKAEKMAGTYFKNFLHMADENGYLHPNIWTMGTRTARMSVTNPALQTLPRDDPTVRTAFIPDTPDDDLVTCDYDQVEARLMAHFSEDPGLIAAFNDTSRDFFCTVASTIFQDSILNKKDKRRQVTKNAFYGKLYGAGAKKMAATAKVPLAQMEAVDQGMNARFPGIVMMQRKINALASGRAKADGHPWIRTPYGRKLVADDRKEYTLTNYLIQSHAGELFKRKLVDLDAVLPDEVRIILPVHDELVFNVPKSMVGEVRPLIERTMSDDTYRVPITCSSDVLECNWGDKYR